MLLKNMYVELFINRQVCEPWILVVWIFDSSIVESIGVETHALFTLVKKTF